MAKINLICEQCGGNIILDDSHEIGTCESCFSQFIIKQDQIVQKITQHVTKHVYGYQGKDIEELLTDGFNLINISNNRLANEKFKRAIDIDTKCWNAWLGYAISLPNNYEYLISKIEAYRCAFDLAANEKEQMDTFIDMLRYLPDTLLKAVFVRAFNLTTGRERRNIFYTVSGVIGCDDSEIASLAIDLCPDDWRAHFAMAKCRKIRAKWAELKGFFYPSLPSAAIEVQNLFIKAYDIAKRENDVNGMDTIKSYIQELATESAYKIFAKEVLKQMK